MPRSVIAFVALCACTREGDLYGGGDGLTLTFEMPQGGTTELHWDGAAKSDLREVNGGLFDSETTWDPVALGATDGPWAVRADDWFDADDHFLALGVDCQALGEEFTAFVNEGAFGIRAVMSAGTEDLYLQVAGAIPSTATVDLFAGEVRAPAQWAGDLEACGNPSSLPAAFTATWSLDEDVRVPNRCFGCGLPEPEFDLNFDIDLTF